ncbi:MAG: hypothetical protein ACE5FD_06475 [Anaerolineae bacterium]
MRKARAKRPAQKTGSGQKNAKAAPGKNAKSVAARKKPADRKLAPKNGSEKKPVKSNGKKNGTNGIKKQYLKSNGWCNVTFRLPKEAAQDAQLVTIVGDFNDWNLSNIKMKRLKNGDFQLTLKLNRDREYRFRYLIDATRWENDWHADQYVPNAFGCEDSLVKV